MKRIIGFAALVMSFILLVSCRGADISISKGSEPSESEREITLYTTAEEAPEQTAPTTLPMTEEKDTEPATTLPPKPEEPQSFESEATEPFVTTDWTDSTDMTASTEDTLVSTAEAQPLEEFSFPEEFYPLMDAILEKYQLNLNCDGGAECLCQPEYELLAEDGSVIEPRERVVSVYFYDINSGFEYFLNSGAHYPVASSVKIPFCTLVYKKIAAGEILPETVLTYEKRHFFKGSGVIVQGEFGQQFTVAELLTLAITRSDNVAYEMLKDLVPWEEFSEYLTQIGCTHKQDIRKSKQKLCLESAGAYGRDLAEFLRSGEPFAEPYKADLLNTRVKMIVSSYPVYRKYGWTGFSFHDIAYVDAPRPYVLAVLTNLKGEDSDDYVMYREISLLIEKASQKQNLGE